MRRLRSPIRLKGALLIIAPGRHRAKLCFVEPEFIRQVNLGTFYFAGPNSLPMHSG